MSNLGAADIGYPPESFFPSAFFQPFGDGKSGKFTEYAPAVLLFNAYGLENPP